MKRFIKLAFYNCSFRVKKLDIRGMCRSQQTAVDTFQNNGDSKRSIAFDDEAYGNVDDIRRKLLLLETYSRQGIEI